MTEASRVRRILVALDATPESARALAAAADLAARLKAELAGLFIEDENLMRLAGLPFAREIAFSTRAARALDPKAIERAFRVQAEAARRAIETVAGPLNVRWSFEVRRGALGRELVAASLETDLIALARSTSPFFRRGELGDVTRVVLSSARRAVFVCDVMAPAENAPVLAIYDGTGSARRALALAAELKKGMDRPLTLLVTGRTEEETAAHEAAAVAALGEEGLPEGEYEILRVEDETGDALARMLAGRPHALVVAGHEVALGQAGAEGLAARIPCHMVILRE